MLLTVNKEFYLQVLKCLRDAVRRKRPKKWSSGYWKIHYDSAASRSSQRVQNMLAKPAVPQVQQPRAVRLFAFQDKTRSEKQNIGRCEDH
jgi:hypothetical protein